MQPAPPQEKAAVHHRTPMGVWPTSARCRVKQIVETRKSEWKDHPSHIRMTYRLVEVAQHSPEWMAKFEAAAKTYFQHRNAWWEHKMQASKVRTEDACRKLVTAARKRIEESGKSGRYCRGSVCLRRPPRSATTECDATSCTKQTAKLASL